MKYRFQNTVLSPIIVLLAGTILVAAEQSLPLSCPPEQGVVLSNQIQWLPRIRLGVEANSWTERAAAENSESGLRFRLNTPGGARTWYRYLSLPIDHHRFPILVMRYRAEGLDPRQENVVLTAGNTQDHSGVERTAVLLRGDIVADGMEREIRKDLRPFAIMGPLTEVSLTVAAAGAPGARAEFTVLSLSFMKPERGDSSLPPATEDSLTVTVNDPGNRPIPGATVTFDAERSNYAQSATTDAHGRASLAPVANQCSLHTVSVYGGGCAVAESFPFQIGGRDSIVIRTLRGKPIGGVITDTQGNALSCAFVQLSLDFDTPVGMKIPTRYELVTDDEGRWSTPPLPHSFTGLRLVVCHPEHERKKMICPGPPDCPESLFELQHSVMLEIRTEPLDEAQLHRSLADIIDNGLIHELKALALDPCEPVQTRLAVLHALEEQVYRQGGSLKDLFGFYTCLAVDISSMDVRKKAIDGVLRSWGSGGHTPNALAAALREKCPPRLLEPLTSALDDLISTRYARMKTGSEEFLTQLQERKQALAPVWLEQGRRRIRRLTNEGRQAAAVAACRELARTLAYSPEFCTEVIALMQEILPDSEHDTEGTVTSFMDSLEADSPDQLSAMLGVGIFFYRRGEYEMAISHLDKLIKTDPGSPWIAKALLTGALCNIRLDEKRNAMVRLERFLADYPRAPEADRAQFLVGWIHLSLEELSQAKEAFELLVNKHRGTAHARKAEQLLKQMGAP